MKKSLSATQPHSPVSDSDPESLNRVVTTAQKNSNSWFVTSQIPADLSIQVEDATFNIHKFPLVSKCGYIRHHELEKLKIEDFPGGKETFEIILKFCYGLPVDLNPDNIAKLRCAAEFLEMTEELEEGNLISKTEALLTFVVLSSWRDNITVLKSCETLHPWAENLQIVRRCCDSVAYKASKDNTITGDIVSEGWWVDDVATLRIDHFMRVMTAIKAKGTKPEIIGKCIMHYAEKWLPHMDVELDNLIGYGYRKNEVEFRILSGKKDGGIGHKEQKTIIESLISLLPAKQEAVSCKFLLQMLKMAMVYSVSPALVSELEKRAGMVLEEATVNDLLIPTRDQGKLISSPDQQTMYDVDVVQRIVEYFLMHAQQQQQQGPGKVDISKLLDNYLAEIAREPNLSITRFQVLAESLPDKARTCHDGLYRAIDTYLKAHPSLSEHDQKRVSKLMNCEKLSLDACMHAAQNERLPLRTVVQVLFSEQIKMREVMLGKEPVAENDNILETSTTDEIKTLKAELENVKIQMMELQQDYSELQRDYEKINSKQRNVSDWSLRWKKMKNAINSNGDEVVGRKQRPKSVEYKVNHGKKLSSS